MTYITINNLLPGRHKTDRVSEKSSTKYNLGNPEDFGTICAFLCSVYASYITGQNIVVDGGETLGIL